VKTVFHALAALIVSGLLATVGLALAAPAQASETAPAAQCPMPKDFYGNPDEQGNLPTPLYVGLFFEGKDLIHHATAPIDLADMDHVGVGFTSPDNPDKVLFKVETSAPYSTIITNPDGKLWSTAMSYDQEGGQGHPVAKYSGLVGKDTKPGKAKFSADSKVVTFGVGYAVEDGTAIVSSISFHGKDYDLTCKPPVSHTSAPAATPSSSTPKPHTSTSHVAGAGTGVQGGSGSTGALAITGLNVWAVTGVGVGIVAVGGALLAALTARRRITFKA
jgi:hypothetical protein